MLEASCLVLKVNVDEHWRWSQSDGPRGISPEKSGGTVIFFRALWPWYWGCNRDFWSTLQWRGANSVVFGGFGVSFVSAKWLGGLEIPRLHSVSLCNSVFSGGVWSWGKTLNEFWLNLHVASNILQDTQCMVYVHPRKLTWIPKMMVWKRYLPLNMAIFGIYVSFRGCTPYLGHLRHQTSESHGNHVFISEVAQRPLQGERIFLVCQLVNKICSSNIYIYSSGNWGLPKPCIYLIYVKGTLLAFIIHWFSSVSPKNVVLCAHMMQIPSFYCTMSARSHEIKLRR